jgi:hypothetical protein
MEYGIPYSEPNPVGYFGQGCLGSPLPVRSPGRIFPTEVQMTTNDRPVVTRKGHEHGNTPQSGGLKLMTGVWAAAYAGDPNLVRQGL